MSVPEEAASTKAKVTLSFSAWKGTRIAPATFEVALVEVSPEEEAKAEEEEKRRAEQTRRLQEKMLPRLIKSLREQLKEATDPKKRQRMQERIERMEKELQEAKKP
ncbi:MAG: hypothetical protein ACYSWU_03340 [Planctomycetota bacterium]